MRTTMSSSRLGRPAAGHGLADLPKQAARSADGEAWRSA